MDTDLADVVQLSLATSALSVAVSRSHPFETFRGWLAGRGMDATCHFCVSFWVSAALVSATGPRDFASVLVTWLASVGGAALVSRTILGE